MLQKVVRIIGTDDMQCVRLGLLFDGQIMKVIEIFAIIPSEGQQRVSTHHSGMSPPRFDEATSINGLEVVRLRVETKHIIVVSG